MAKNFRRILATTLVMCMLISALPMQALAAEDSGITATETITGGDITITFTPTENEGESSVDVSGTNESGATVDLGGSSVTTTETTTDSNGTVTESTSTEVILFGTETTTDGTIKDVTYQDKTTDTTVTGADGSVAEKTVNSGSETKEWDAMDTGDGEQPPVTVVLTPGQTTTGQATDTVVSGDVPTSSTDKNYDYSSTTTIDRTVEATTQESEITVESTGSGEFKPIQTDRDMIYDEANQLHTHSNTSYKQTSNVQSAMQNKPQDEQYDFLFIGQGQMSDFYVGLEDKNGNTAHSGALQFELLYDPSVENGQYVKNEEDLFTAYCVDVTTSAVAGYWYKMDNLEDAGYYSEEAAAQIRSIVSTGYWGTNPGEDTANPATGSLEKLKQVMKTAGNSGLTDEEIDQLTPGQALAATQAAIWSYANATTDGNFVDEERLIITGYKAPTVPTDDDFKKAEAVYNFLRNLTPTEKSESTEIIDKESFIKEDSMSLTVGNKVESASDNYDEDYDNDVYNVSVNFALVVTPTDDDNLVVQVVRIDAGGNMIVEAQGRIAGDASGDEGFNEVVYNEATGEYSLKNLHLAENSDFSFDLKLVGTQHLQEGVYIFNSEVRNDVSSQTFVGMAEGEKEVNVKQSFVINFNVDENTTVIEQHVWSEESDPGYTPGIPEYPVTPADFEEVPPPQIFRLNNQNGLETIPEEPVPLAAPVITGDGSALWMAVVLMAMVAMVAINLNDKKQRSF